MDKLGKVLETVVARQPRSAILIEARLKLALAAVLGPDLAAGCRAEARGSTVRITTPSRALAAQLRSDSEHLIRRLNEASHLPGRVRRLQVRVSLDPGPPPPARREGRPAR